MPIGAGSQHPQAQGWTDTASYQVLLDLPEKLERGSERTISMTRRERPVLAVMPWEFYESIVETVDVLSAPDMVSAATGGS